MQTFPPALQAFSRRTRDALDATGAARGAVERQEPDTRSPSRYLRWLLRRQADLVAASAVVGALWFLPSAVNPWLLGRAIDEGVSHGSVMATLPWALLMVLSITLGVVGGTLMHTSGVTGFLVAMYKTIQLVQRKATQLGHVATRRTPSGEMLSIAGGDADVFGMVFEVTGRAIAALAAFGFVAALVLGESVKLGVVTLIAAPVLVGASAPLLKPLQRAQASERSRSSELTGMATDIVAGLRILRGIGGERTFGDNYANQSQRVRRAGVRAGSWQAAVDALSVLLSGLLLVLLTWLGTREMLAGRLSIGQLVSFFGYAIFMVWPISTFFEFVQKWVQGLVAARKTIAVLGQRPAWQDSSDPVPLPHGAVIVDESSGAVLQPHRLTVVVSAVPDDSAALADRIGRYLPAETEAVSLQVDEDLKGRAAKRAQTQKEAELASRIAADESLATSHWGVSFDGVDLSRVPLDEVRARVLVNGTTMQVFAGTLQELLDPHGRATRQQAEEALRTASAEDVYDALPGGWQGVLDERGRGLSGGQRQRLVLARALLADPEVLVLVEPTSAVDAHTEARIAERLAQYRRGRTTIITTVSPLLLHHADEVVLLLNGKAVAQGSHAELLASNAAYRDVVVRDMADEPDQDPTGGQE
ncbi:ABC transporter transmembrane domain-containing protein [Luteococcus sp. OSA5]|uniref:ABC transporter transmembrane domain-containing protein n=1 Tax=Luteococcus sp. OSA5 TaxID=3401630 RepID=UPI003B433FD1